MSFAKVVTLIVITGGVALGGVLLWATRVPQPSDRCRWSKAEVWNESIVHYTPQAIEAFRVASASLTRKLRAAYPSQVSCVVLVPTTSGYEIRVLADFDRTGVRGFVDSQISNIIVVREELARAMDAQHPK